LASSLRFFQHNAQPRKINPANKEPTSGMTTSATSDDTILPNAASMTTQTAISTTLPFIANSLNSETKLITAS
jgi:hypothetical protein